MNTELRDLLATSTKELEQLLSTKTVVGEPLELNGSTIVPLLTVGFGLGVGGGGGQSLKQGEGSGQGIGCGGGVKPVAVIISDKNGTRVEGLHGAAASVLEKVVDTVGKSLDRAKSEAEPS